YTKAFDKVRHDEIINILEQLHIDGKDLRIKNIYWEQIAAMRVDNEIGEYQKIRRGIDGNDINNLRYADDTVLLAETEEDLQSLLNTVIAESERKGLPINNTKTKTLVVIKKGQIPSCNITANRTMLKQEEKFNQILKNGVYRSRALSQLPEKLSNYSDVNLAREGRSPGRWSSKTKGVNEQATLDRTIHAGSKVNEELKDSAVSNKIKILRKSEDMMHSMIVPVWIHHESNIRKKVLVYALLDEQSDACFIKESTMNELNILGSKVHLKLTTVTGEETIESTKTRGLIVCGKNEKIEIALPVTYSRKNIPARHDQIPRPESVEGWPHLQRVANELMPYDRSVEVGLLIGLNCIRAIKPRELIPGKDDEPYARRTLLGWSIIGRVNGDYQDTSDSDSVLASKVIVNKVIINGDTKYDKVKFPNSKELAMCRLMSLKRKLKQKNGFLQDYVAFMKDLIDKGYAEEAPYQGPNFNDGRVWYIPHHGVYHPKKPDKIRVVFDCSAVYKNESLNKNLLQGPDLTNNLIGVLCRFRKEHVAIACDIEAIFHQVKVKPDHRDLLRFLWWENGNPDSTVKEYRMTVHLFGATSSPSVVSFALKATADDYAWQCGTEAASFVKNEFYVDDGLTSLPTTAEAIALIRNSKALCSKGGFKLHKFLSNKKEVLEAISLEEKAKSFKNLDLSSEALPIERTLGVEWCIESDTFQFRISINDKPITRRGILSTVSSVFDPMGMVSPFILIGKRILQTLCQDGVDWDDDISDNLKQQWRRWRDDLIQLKELKIPRCYKPDVFRKVKSLELHHFSDASQHGYGQCSYLRQVSEQGQVHCALVMSKSRVTPLKPITVPRLELTAAVVAVRISSMLRKELGYQEVKEYFWTDSKVILGYISNEAKRFHVFVANRVQHIKDHSSMEQWKFVESVQILLIPLHVDPVCKEPD
ncbi:uncharacterized protein LOC134788408, partial [Penaeus indicus]|uniref:uncharacterized protein LOC134788408 n=1 Tax=Penaeus indicus TaxID=29960 RepID=UPI00300C21E5